MAQSIFYKDFRLVKRNRFWWRFYNIPLWVLAAFAVISNGITLFTAYNGFMALAERDGKITQAEQNAALGGTATTLAGMQLIYIPVGLASYLFMLLVAFYYRSEATESLRIKLLLALRAINPEVVSSEELVTDMVIELDSTEQAQLKRLLDEIKISTVTDDEQIHLAFERLKQSLKKA